MYEKHHLRDCRTWKHSSGIARATRQIQPLLIKEAIANRDNSVRVEITLIQREKKEVLDCRNSYFRKAQVGDILDGFVFCLMHRICYYMISF